MLALIIGTLVGVIIAALFTMAMLHSGKGRI